MEQRSQEWYDKRLGKLSGSGIGQIMGSVKMKRALNSAKKESVIDFLVLNGMDREKVHDKKLTDLKKLADDFPERMVWEPTDGTMSYIENKVGEYLTGIITETPITFDMQRGIDLEPVAEEEWASLYPEINGGTPGFIDYNEHCGGSPDFLGLAKQGKVVGAEFKCPKQHIHVKYVVRIKSPQDLMRINKTYYWQVIFYMLVCNADMWYWVSYHPDFPVKNVFDIVFDRKDPEIQLSLSQLEFALTNAVEEKLKMIELFT